MKRLISLVFVVVINTVMMALPTLAADNNTNLIANASVETATTSGAPSNWTSNKWGTNSATFEYKATGHTGNRSLYTNMTSRTDGDAKWVHDSVAVQPNTSYTYSSWYKSSVPTEIDIQYTSTSGVVSYVYANSVAPNANWQVLSTNFVTPMNVAKVSVMHIVAGVGWLQTDDFSLSSTIIAPPATNGNYILNSSFETANGASPASWYKNSWGTNNAQFSYETTGRTGSKSVKITMGAYTNGDAKWYAEPVAVTAGKMYSYQDFYKSNVPTRVVVAFIDSANNYSFMELAGATASTTAWSEYDNAFTAPATAVKATIYHIIDSVGNLTIDDASLLDATPTPSPDPVIYNSSLEIANGSIPANWQKNNWGSNTTKYEYVNEGHTGNKSVRVTISKYTSGDAKWYFNPITTLQAGKQYRFTAWYKTNVTPKAVCMLNMADGSTRYSRMPVALPNGSTTSWQKYTDTCIIPTGTISVSVFMFIDENGWLQTDDYSLTAYNPVGFSRPLLSMTFDDGPQGNVNTALPLLNQYGYKATQCYVTADIEGQPAAGLNEVLAFSNSGHEICSHSVSHPFLTSLTATNLTYELQHSKQYLESITGKKVVDIASPYGDYNAKVITEMKKYYRSHRSVDEGFNSKDNFNIYNIRVQNVLSTTSAEQIGLWLDQAKATKTWLVLVYHRVASDPGEYDTNTNVFIQHLKTIGASGITVKTYNDALDELITQL